MSIPKPLNMLTLANIACLVLITFEIFLNRLLRSKNSDVKREDQNSTLIIWVVMIIVILVSFLLPQVISLPMYLNPSFQYIGVAIIFFGIIFRLAAVLTLGRFFTVDVAIRKDHRLKKDGLYKYLRHPAYLASLLTFVGMGWTFNNWISFLLLTVAIFILLNHRIKIEEQLLTTHFGSEYVEYQKVTNRLIPFVY